VAHPARFSLGGLLHSLFRQHNHILRMPAIEYGDPGAGLALAGVTANTYSFPADLPIA
jgi:hypothetical protein